MATTPEPRVQKIGAVTVVSPRGPLSGDAAVAFAQLLADKASESLGRLVVDLEAVPTLDSLGLETLVDAALALEDSGIVLRLAGVNPLLETVLEITGQADVFDRYADADEAARSFL